MFLGYCYDAHTDAWMPPVHLDSAEAAHRYCDLHRHLFVEVRITDADDYCVMHMREHILYVPYPDGLLHRFDMRTRQPLGPITVEEAP